MRIGLSFNKQAACVTELGATGVGGGVGLRTSRTTSSSVVCKRLLPASSLMSERGGTLVRRVAQLNVRWQGRRLADGDVTHYGVARRLSLRFSLPISMRITHDRISELLFGSVAKGI